MVEPRSTQPDDLNVPEDATEEPHTRGDEEEDDRAARRESQQERSPHPIWPDADYPFRQAGESSPAPWQRRH